MTPYPTSISPEVEQLVIGLLMGTVPDKTKAFHAVWETSGYVLGLLYPEGVVRAPFAPPSVMAATPMSATEAVDALKHLSGKDHAAAHKAMAAMPAFNWQAFLAALLQAWLAQAGK